jgi:hypothetical protein
LIQSREKIKEPLDRELEQGFGFEKDKEATR